jgi:mRNA interferase RelE/StbE
MKTAYRKRFLKDLAALPGSIRARIETFAFETMPRADTFAETGKVEKMRGYTHCYKARFGDYRIGLVVRDDTVYFERVLHRRDIYRYFP